MKKILNINNFFVAIVSLILLSSCSGYQQVSYPGESDGVYDDTYSYEELAYQENYQKKVREESLLRDNLRNKEIEKLKKEGKWNNKWNTRLNYGIGYSPYYGYSNNFELSFGNFSRYNNNWGDYWHNSYYSPYDNYSYWNRRNWRYRRGYPSHYNGWSSYPNYYGDYYNNYYGGYYGDYYYNRPYRYDRRYYKNRQKISRYGNEPVNSYRKQYKYNSGNKNYQYKSRRNSSRNNNSYNNNRSTRSYGGNSSNRTYRSSSPRTTTSRRTYKSVRVE